MSAALMERLFDRLHHQLSASVRKEQTGLKMTWEPCLSVSDTLQVSLAWNDTTATGELTATKECPGYGLVTGVFAVPARMDTLIWGDASCESKVPHFSTFIPEAMMLKWIPLMMQVTVVPEEMEESSSLLLTLHFGRKCSTVQKDGSTLGMTFDTFAFTTVVQMTKTAAVNASMADSKKLPEPVAGSSSPGGNLLLLDRAKTLSEVVSSTEEYELLDSATHLALPNATCSSCP